MAQLEDSYQGMPSGMPTSKRVTGFSRCAPGSTQPLHTLTKMH
jgi:hypothetical protein